MSDTLSVSVSEKVGTEDGLVSSGPIHYRKDGCLYSVYPPTAYLTFGVWIYMVPPFKPSSVLMLGYAGGTVAGLIQMLHGDDVPITAVDYAIVDNRYHVDLIQADARSFVKYARQYECVILDIFNGQDTPEFVCELPFVNEIARICTEFLVIHSSPDANVGIYEQHFSRLRMLDIGHKVSYYCVPGSQRRYFPE